MGIPHWLRDQQRSQQQQADHRAHRSFLQTGQNRHRMAQQGEAHEVDTKPSSMIKTDQRRRTEVAEDQVDQVEEA